MIMKRWLSVFAENEIGVLARVAGLFAGKSYNLNSLTVGPTEDPTVSRMTIGLTSDDRTFEQVVKQLDRCVEVIKVIDLTETASHQKELLFVKVRACTRQEINDLFRFAGVFSVNITDYCRDAVLLESTAPETRNDELIRLLREQFPGRIEIVRGGGVAIEAIGLAER